MEAKQRACHLKGRWRYTLFNNHLPLVDVGAEGVKGQGHVVGAVGEVHGEVDVVHTILSLFLCWGVVDIRIMNTHTRTHTQKYAYIHI